MVRADNYKIPAHRQALNVVPVYFKTATSANTPQDFTNLDSAQKLFIKNYLADANTLISKYQPHSNNDNFTSQTRVCSLEHPVYRN